MLNGPQARLYRVQPGEDLGQQLALVTVSVAGTLRSASGPWLILALITMQQLGHLLARSSRSAPRPTSTCPATPSPSRIRPSNMCPEPT